VSWVSGWSGRGKGQETYFDGRLALAVVSDLQGSYCEVADGVDLAVFWCRGAGLNAFLDGLGEGCGREEQGSEDG
jgi:hypothetical protein